MSRNRFLVSRGRGSYKSSEVVALFILSVIGGMIVCIVGYVIDFLVSHVLHLRS